MRLGFVGLGIMGRPMTRNLLRAGFEVAAYNRSAGPREEIARAGARIVDSAEEAARGADLVVTIVTDSPDVEEVILGDRGVLAGAGPGTLVVDMSTISPEVTRRVGARLAERGVRMVDAPVSGGDTGAEAGTLSIMAGGDAADVDRARPVFDVLGSRVVHCGPLGSGQTVKLCNQIAVALTNLAVSEALVFAERSGIDPERMVEAVSAGAGASWQMTHLAPRMIAHDFRPGFKVRLQQKDLRLALESAHELGLELRGLSLVHELFAVVERSGGGNEGTQALKKAVERR